jgi:hypothetical protein
MRQRARLGLKRALIAIATAPSPMLNFAGLLVLVRQLGKLG